MPYARLETFGGVNLHASNLIMREDATKEGLIKPIVEAVLSESDAEVACHERIRLVADEVQMPPGFSLKVAKMEAVSGNVKVTFIFTPI